MIRTTVVRSQADSLGKLLDKAISDRDLPTYAQGHMGRYACVIAAGFLENALAETLCAYVAVRAQPAVAAFSNATLRKIQNPKASRFVEIVSRFNKDWGSDLDVYMSDGSERRKSAINSIMANRHLIAHGKNSNVTLRQVKDYFEASVEVIEYIELKIYGP